MPEQRSAVPENVEDVQLIIEYLNKQLDPDRAAAVAKRLQEDPVFLDLAGPLLVAWSVPTHWERNPVPQAELEKHWDRFTKAAGFAHQKINRRRRLLTGGSIIIILLYFVWLMVA